jgi:hypothetical protein
MSDFVVFGIPGSPWLKRMQVRPSMQATEADRLKQAA